MTTAKTTKPTVSRDALLVRSAKFRAAIMAHVKQNPDATQADLAEFLKDLMAEEQVTESTIVGQLKNLVDNNQLSVNKGHRPLRYNVIAGKEPKPPKQAAVAAAKNSTVPTFTVDIVKSSGRVRLQLAGFSIEIGVVDQ